MIEHLPKELHASVGRAMREAWDGADAALAKKRLQRLASALQAKHPGAASSPREGLDETLTAQTLSITGRCTARCAPPTRSRTSTVRSRTTHAMSSDGATAR